MSEDTPGGWIGAPHNHWGDGFASYSRAALWHPLPTPPKEASRKGEGPET